MDSISQMENISFFFSRKRVTPPPNKFEKIYCMLIEEVRAALPEIKIILMEPFILKGPSTETLWDAFDTEVKLHAAAAKRVAERYDLPFVTLQDKFDAACARCDAAWWSGDGVHPSYAGHQLIKDALMEKINGVNIREKFRIRYYNHDTSVIHLEKKSKINKKETSYTLLYIRLPSKKCNIIIVEMIDLGNQQIKSLIYKIAGKDIASMYLP